MFHRTAHHPIPTSSVGGLPRSPWARAVASVSSPENQVHERICATMTVNYDEDARAGDFEFPLVAAWVGDASDHVIFGHDENNQLCHLVVKGQIDGDEEANVLAEIGSELTLTGIGSDAGPSEPSQPPSAQSSREAVGIYLPR